MLAMKIEQSDSDAKRPSRIVRHSSNESMCTLSLVTDEYMMLLDGRWTNGRRPLSVTTLCSNENDVTRSANDKIGWNASFSSSVLIHGSVMLIRRAVI